MTHNIKLGDGTVGLDPIVYTLKPAKKSDFDESTKVEAFYEPQTIMEELVQIIKKAKKNLGNILS